jgi:S1-C subfamily serine protease
MSPSSPSYKDPSLTNIFKLVENSVVRIMSEPANPAHDIIANKSAKKGQAFRLGSGFIYDDYGHIITNNHVIGTARSVAVTFVDGNIYNADVIGKDQFSDIAVLQIPDDFSGEQSTHSRLLIHRI